MGHIPAGPADARVNTISSAELVVAAPTGEPVLPVLTLDRVPTKSSGSDVVAVAGTDHVAPSEGLDHVAAGQGNDHVPP
jgi:hypothetical protein